MKKTVRRMVAVLALAGLAGLGAPAANATEVTAADGRILKNISFPCHVERWNNQVKLTCNHSSREVRGKINCRAWRDQYTSWITDGVSYSGGCPFGVNDVDSGDPTSMEVRTK